MKKISLFISSLILSVNLLADAPKAMQRSDYIDPRELEKETKLLKLINAEIKSIKGLKKKREQLSYRYFELHFEKLKIVKKREVRKSIIRKKKVHHTKEKSYKLYLKAQKLADQFLRKYPKSYYLSDVYNAKASMIIEILNTPEKDQILVLDLLKKSIRMSRNFKQKYVAKVKLAEFYYTLNKWDQAVSYYKDVTRYKKDPWLTKNLYNYSWCLFQQKKYALAIKYLKLTHRYSYSKKYINFKDQVLDSINYFYVFNKEPKKAIDFHLRNRDSDLTAQFVKTLKITKKYLSLKESINIEEYARSFCVKKNNNVCLINLSHFRIATAREIKNYQMHYHFSVKAANEFKKLSKKEIAQEAETIELLVDNIRSLTTFFQQMAYKGHYRLLDGQEKTYQKIISYYWILKRMNPEKIYEYSYLQGEISFKEKKYENADKFYRESLGYIDKKQVKDIKYRQKVLDSMIALANEKNYQNDSFFELSYLSFIKYYPKENKSGIIYQNIFKFYMKKTQITKGDKLVSQYHKNIPKHLKVQKDMYKELLNYYITKKDMKTLSKMISSMKKGYLKFNKKFIETNTVILGGLLFTRAQNFEKQSNYKVAIEEYIKLYEYEGYPIKIKMESALNIAIAYLKLNNTKSSYSWSKKSMKYYKNKYFSEKMPVYFQMAEKYFLLQDLERSKELYGKLFFNFCHMVKDRKLKSSHYAKFQNMNILTKSYKKYKLANKKANACKIDNKAREQVAAVYVEHVLTEQKYDEINKIKNQVEYKKYNYEIFNYYLSKLWMEENSLNGVNESKVFQSFSKFIDGNNFIKISDKNEISYYKEFLSYLNKVKNYNYEIAIKTPFDLNGFIKDIESKMIEFAKVKQIGDKLANRTKYPMAYVSIQAVQKMNIEKIYYVFSKLDLSKQVKEPQIKKQLDENIKNILSGFDQQRIAVSKNINDTIRKNKSLSGYSKYAYFDRELFETSLYQKDDMSLIYVGK